MSMLRIIANFCSFKSLFFNNRFVFCLLTIFQIGLMGCGFESGDQSGSNLLIIGGESLTPAHVGHSNTVGLSEISGGMGLQSRPSCSGFIVASSWIVTAAHCVAPGRLKYVYFQNVEVKQEETWRKIDKVMIHPEWKGQGLFDLAVVHFIEETGDRNGNPNGFSPVQIASEELSQRERISETMDIVGYGSEKFPIVDIPQKRHANVKIARFWHDYFMGPGLVTYDDPEKKGACYGDSGGPGYIRDEHGEPYVLGITQGARGRYFQQMNKVDCSDGKGVYTWLAPFKHWIEISVSGKLSASYPWATSESDFQDLYQFCKSEKKRDVWNSFFSLSLILEEKTQVPFFDCQSLVDASTKVKDLELNPWSHYAATQSIFKFLPNLERLKIRDDNGGFSPDVDLKEISSLSRLMVFSVDGPSLANKSELAKLTSLTNLDLFGTTEVDISLIVPLKNLLVLSIAGSAASDLAALGSISSLQKLSTRRCVLDAKSIDGLLANDTFYNLKSADFSRCGVDLAYLSEHFEKFKKFKLGTEFKFQKSLSIENSKIENRISRNVFGLKISFH